VNPIDFRISPAVSNQHLNRLFASAWAHHLDSDFQPVLQHSLLYVCAYTTEQLIGFVNIAWDGGQHAFLLDTTVHADFQHQGIGVQLVETAIEAVRARGVTWLHVDYEPHLRLFYEKCGFQDTEAGLIHLQQGAT
jgi:GNAT superfamily N-acetyltransferase